MTLKARITEDMKDAMRAKDSARLSTIRMLLALTSPSSGTIEVLGHDISHHPHEALRGVGTLVEGPAFYPFLSGERNLMIFDGAGADGERRTRRAGTAVPEDRLHGPVARAVDAERDASGKVKAVTFKLGKDKTPHPIECDRLIVADGVRSPLGRVLGRVPALAVGLCGFGADTRMAV